MHSFDTVLVKLRENGFKLTPQRLAIIRYLEGNKSHPHALKIHKELKRKYPTLSFSTVYNTLNMLETIGEISSVNIFDEYVNFDPETKPHIHFYCEKCGAIKDIFFEEVDGFSIPLNEIKGNIVKSVQITMRGVCADCREKEKEQVQ